MGDNLIENTKELMVENERITRFTLLFVRGPVERKKGGFLSYSYDSEKDMFEVTAMERQGSARDPGAK